MKKIFIASILVLVSAIPVFVFAGSFKTGEVYVLPVGEMVKENLNVAGENVSIAGEVDGDLVLAGERVSVSGSSSGDLLSAGGSVNVSGVINGDARVAGGDILISGNIKGDLIVFGGSVILSEIAVISGDIVIFGGDVKILGKANKDVSIFAGDLIINGEILGNLKFKGGEISLGDLSKIQGDLTYSISDKDDFKVSDTAIILGKTEFNVLKSRQFEGALLGAIFSAFILKAISIVLASALFLWLFPNIFAKASAKASLSITSFAKRFLLGLAIICLSPIVSIILFGTFIGWLIAIIIIAGFVTLATLSVVLSSLLVADIIFKLLKKEHEILALHPWKRGVLGGFVMSILSFIPIIGWIICLCIFITSFGSLSLNLWRGRNM